MFLYKGGVGKLIRKKYTWVSIYTYFKCRMADGVIADQFTNICGMETLVFTFELVFHETPLTGGATQREEGFTSGGRCLSAPTSDQE